jgi:hypothetical protein
MVKLPQRSIIFATQDAETWLPLSHYAQSITEAIQVCMAWEERLLPETTGLVRRIC